MKYLLSILCLFVLSCDSEDDDSGNGGGSNCSVNPVGTWEFTQFDLDFSDECNCGEDTHCNNLLDTSLLDEVSCLTVGIAGENITVNIEICDPSCLEGNRTLEDCYFTESYDCNDNLISSDGNVWEINDTDDVATTIRIESTDEFEASLQEFFPDWELDTGGLDLGNSCTITSDIILTKY